MRVIGTGVSVKVAVALTVCTVSTFAFMWYKYGGDVLGDEGVVREIPAWAAPADGVFTFESLAKFDGKKLPMCLGVCGKVVNVSSSANFSPDQGYGKLWAGMETTYAMAKVSLTPDDANRLDFKLDDFTPQERTALAGWYKHFTTKYPIVGTLKELDGWDFSTVFEEAKTQTPFGIGKEKGSDAKDGDAVAAAVAEAAAAEKEKPKAEAWVLRKGAKVLIKGSVDEPQLNGVVGIVLDFVAEKSCFSVSLPPGHAEEKALVKPSNLAEPPGEATD